MGSAAVAPGAALSTAPEATAKGWKAALVPYLTAPVGRPPRPRPHARPPPPLASGSVRVALLLPLTGANARLGRAMLDAAQLALFAFADDHFELLPLDTKGTPQGAAEAVQFAIGDGASLVLGPLLASSVAAVAPATRAAGVPVLSFSSDRSVAGTDVYTMGFLPGEEIERVVRFAHRKGLRRFAVLAPDNAYGATVVDAARHVTGLMGADVVRVQLYDPDAGDVQDAIRTLAHFDARREALIEQRRVLEARGDEVAMRALKRLRDLQTVGDLPFDALLLADGGKRLQTIAAHLPFYDVDPAKVRMLGTGQWDEPGIGAEPALIGGWFAAPPPKARANFEEEFKTTYGAMPPRLATLAYDATALAAVLAKAEGGADFSAAAITQPSGYWGRDGIFRFLGEGITQRGLAVLEIRPAGTRVISEAPESFQAMIN